MGVSCEGHRMIVILCSFLAGAIGGAVAAALVWWHTPPRELSQRQANMVLALALCWSGRWDCEAAEHIPQRIWDVLYEKKLIANHSDMSGDSEVYTTKEGTEYLLAAVQRLNPGGPFA